MTLTDAIGPDLAERKRRVLPRGVYNIHPITVASGSGSKVQDGSGREYVDFAGGIGVLNVGHTHPRVVEAIRAQAGRLTHMCFHVAAYEPYIELVEKLVELTPGRFAKKGILVNSGVEAVENAVKIARHWTGRPGILCFDHAFHGRTLLGMSLTSKEDPYRKGFGPLWPQVHRNDYPYCYRCPLGLAYPGCDVACLDQGLEKLDERGVTAESIAAIIVEPVLGEGGFVVSPAVFLRRLRDWCSRHGVVFIADEIQSGFGRTGRMFAMQHFDLEPDITVMAKSIAGGMPLSAVIGRAEIMDSPQPGGLGGTYAGNPVACAAALAVLDVFREEQLLEKALRLGEQLLTRLRELQRQFPRIGDVRGLGAMVAIELIADPVTREPDAAATRAILEGACRRGLILLKAGTHNNVIRLLPPLNIPGEVLERGLAIVEETLGEVLGS